MPHDRIASATPPSASTSAANSLTPSASCSIAPDASTPTTGTSSVAIGGPADLMILRDCGHVPHREQADAVLARVAGFADAIPGPAFPGP